MRSWFASHVIGETELWIAEDPKGELAGILVLDGPWIDQLYVDPTLTGRGIGTALVNLAKRERRDGLRLWTFASNTGAQRFYAKKRVSPFGVYVRRRGENPVRRRTP